MNTVHATLCPFMSGASVVAGPAGCESNLGPSTICVPRTNARARRSINAAVLDATLKMACDAFMAVPALGGQRFEYLREQIGNFSTDERRSSRMQGAFNPASAKPQQSADDLANYLSHLPAQRYAEGDPRFHAEGEKNYATLCAACHVEGVRGNPAKTIPSLRTQHDAYLVNRLRLYASTSPTVKIAAHEVDAPSLPFAAYLSSLRGVDDDSAKPPPP